MSFFLFPGQGSQRPAMGKDFYDGAEEVRTFFDQAEAMLGPSFLKALFEGDESAIAHTTVAQPGLLVVETAIAHFLETNGFPPSGCAGHSLGEIPALVMAGALRFEDALPLTIERARLMSEDVPKGGMAAVMGLEADKIEAALPDEVQVANFNGPNQTIVSGTIAGLAAAEAALKAAGAKRFVPLKVSGPFHSRLMRKAADAFQAVLEPVAFQAPKTVFVSTVSGKMESDPDTIKGLLARQLYSPVRWTEAVAAIQAPLCVEIGPGGVLRGLLKRMEGTADVVTASTLDEARALIEI